MAYELYRHFDADDRLLYIGVSGSSLKRFGQHKIASEWADQVVTIRIERFPSQLEAQIAEIEAILSEKPIHNALNPHAESMLEALKRRLAASPVKPKTINELNRLVPDDETRTKAGGYERYGQRAEEP